MAKDRYEIDSFLEKNYKFTKEQIEKHTENVLADLNYLARYEKNKTFKRETVLAVAFSPVPSERKRNIDPTKDHKIILDYKKPYTLADDKKEFPSIFDNEFVVGIKTNKRVLTFRVYARYRWNNADIWGFLQIIALCSKDDRRVILGSGIHDFLLEYKQELFEHFKEQDPTIDVDAFRWITSDTFGWIIKSQGMGPIKSKMMKNVVDCFQKHFQKKKWNIEENE